MQSSDPTAQTGNEHGSAAGPHTEGLASAGGLAAAGTGAVGTNATTGVPQPSFSLDAMAGPSHAAIRARSEGPGGYGVAGVTTSSGEVGAPKRKMPNEDLRSGSLDALKQMMQDQLDELNKNNLKLETNLDELRAAAGR